MSTAGRAPKRSPTPGAARASSGTRCSRNTDTWSRAGTTPAGYAEGAPLAYADSLKGQFLLVHGTGDDNVHFQNSIRLVERLEAANKQFGMRIYPNKTHAIAGGNTRENLYELFTTWVKQNL